MATAMWFIRQQQRKQCGKRKAKDVAIIWCGVWLQRFAETTQIRTEKSNGNCDCCNRATVRWWLYGNITERVVATAWWGSGYQHGNSTVSFCCNVVVRLVALTGWLLWMKEKVVATEPPWLPHHSVSGYNIGIIGITIPQHVIKSIFFSFVWL